jgi:hypothetical protein
MKGTEIAVKAANTVENATKKVDNEVARESRRQAESQGGTTIVMGTTVPRPTRMVPPRLRAHLQRPEAQIAYLPSRRC